jgi:hypothetical protein
MSLFVPSAICSRQGVLPTAKSTSWQACLWNATARLATRLLTMQLKLVPEQIGLSAVPYQLHFKE